jgi:hypothetical protein
MYPYLGGIDVDGTLFEEDYKLKKILKKPVNIFSDDFIKSLYNMDWDVRNWTFINLFNNIEIVNKYKTNPCPQIGKSSFDNPKNWVNLDAQPPYDENMSLDDYLKLVPDFNDPFDLIIKEHDGIYVVRDDLLPGGVGSKARYAEALMQQVEEKYLLYAGVPQGQAMITLARACKKYNKILICIAPNRKEPTKAHINAMEAGAIFFYYQTGGQAGARKRCRAFINDQLLGGGLYIPAGVKNKLITAGFAKSAVRINENYNPDALFCVASTGVMSHALSIALPDTEIFAIQVAGNSSTKKWPGRLNVINHNQPFNEKVKDQDAPPFNSILTYDAKGWKYCKEFKQNNPDKTVMFWNVKGEK